MTRGLHYGVKAELGLDGNEDVGMCQLSLENLVIYLGQNGLLSFLGKLIRFIPYFPN